MRQSAPADAPPCRGVELQAAVEAVAGRDVPAATRLAPGHAIQLGVVGANGNPTAGLLGIGRDRREGDGRDGGSEQLAHGSLPENDEGPP